MLFSILSDTEVKHAAATEAPTEYMDFESYRALKQRFPCTIFTLILALSTTIASRAGLIAGRVLEINGIYIMSESKKLNQS